MRTLEAKPQVTQWSNGAYFYEFEGEEIHLDAKTDQKAIEKATELESELFPLTAEHQT